MKKEYTEIDRNNDFDFFIKNYEDLYNKYGYCYIAIRFEEILGVYKSVQEAINILSNKYELGEYIIQECNGNESGYTNYISSWQLIG